MTLKNIVRNQDNDIILITPNLSKRTCKSGKYVQINSSNTP